MNLKITYNIVAVALILLFAIGAIYFYSKNISPLSDQLSNRLNKQTSSEESLIKANEAFNNNDFATAKKILDDRLQVNSKDTKVLLLKAQTIAQEASLTFKEKELGDAAREIALQILKLEPKNLAALTLIGYTYEIQENYAKAHEFYDKVLDLDNEYLKALIQKGHSYSLQGEPEKAKEIYLKIDSLDPKNTTNLTNLSNIFLLENKQSQAEEYLNKALKLSSNIRNKSDIYYSLGTIQENSGKNDEALKIYKLAMETDPSAPLPYVGLARMQFRLNKIPESFDNLAIALEKNPNQSVAVLQLAIQYIVMGDKNTAKQILAKLPDIINRDISLDSNSKKVMLATVKFMVSDINKTK